ncbi:MAG: RsmE family RNA methyltransferase, partial [Candidatus Omnitrophica bacterium]|nr:RsmE family RNA methyltransferase [Candidatus Omnitrophota bacterium]
MHRFFCASLEAQLKHLRLEDPQEVHHCVRVLRLHPGDELELINGRGALARARFVTAGKHWLDLELLTYEQSPQRIAPGVILVCALPKKSAFDDIIEKCTELGV